MDLSTTGETTRTLPLPRNLWLQHKRLRTVKSSIKANIFHSEPSLSEIGQQGLALWPDDRSQGGDEITAGSGIQG
jgi:hypothetical protein